MVIIEKLEVALEVIEKNALEILKKAETQLQNTEKAQRKFSESSTKNLGLYAGAIIGAMSALVFWLNKTSPLVEYHMSNIGFSFERIGMIVGEVLEPAFNTAEQTVNSLADSVEKAKDRLDEIEESGGMWEEFKRKFNEKILIPLGVSLPAQESIDNTMFELNNMVFNAINKNKEGVSVQYPPEIVDLPGGGQTVTSKSVVITTTDNTGGGGNVSASGMTWEEFQRNRQETFLREHGYTYSELYSKNFISTSIYNKLTEAGMT